MKTKSLLFISIFLISEIVCAQVPRNLNIIEYHRNGELYFRLIDPTRLPQAIFCFRTVDNHMTIDNFKVYQLEQTLIK